MAYPDLGIERDGSNRTPDVDLNIERATNGSPRGRVFATGAKNKFSFKHRVAAAGLATFEAFWNANMTATFSFTWPDNGTTYTVIFSKAPQIRPLGGGSVEITVALEEA